MHLVPPSRRALGLAAVGAIALSTTVFVSGGVAHADAVPSWSASGSGDSAPVPAGICRIHWTLTGASGGAAGDGTAGARGGELEIWTPATAGEVYTLSPGSVGAVGVSDGSAAAGGTNAGGAASTQGGAGGTDGSGGGGAASVVQAGGSVHLLAYGGDGGGATGGPGGGNESNAGPWPLDSWQKGPAAGPGAGSITGVGLPCRPLPPYLMGISGGDGEMTLYFADMPPTDGRMQTVGFEYTIDGGTTWRPLDADPADDTSWVTVPGLINGTPYTVQLRALGGPDTVPSEPGNPMTITPWAPVGAPTDLVVTPGPSSATVTWEAPAPVPGTPEITGYEVAWSSDDMGGLFCTTTPDVRTCTAPLVPGRAYMLSVYAIDGAFGLGEVAEVSTGVIPFSPTVPAANGALHRAGPATVAAGSKVTLTGSGYAPGSDVTVLVYSQPQVLATTVADGDGRISVEVTVPAGLAPGSHTLVAVGVDPHGDPYTLTLPITVRGGTTGAAGLAYTGADVAVPAIGGVAALAVGGALVLAGRHRRAEG